VTRSAQSSLDEGLSRDLMTSVATRYIQDRDAEREGTKERLKGLWQSEMSRITTTYTTKSSIFPAVMAQRKETTSIFSCTPAVGNNPTVGARFESRGGHPLAQVTCDLLRVALRLLGYRFSRAIGQSDRAHGMAISDYIDVCWWGVGRELWDCDFLFCIFCPRW
jgi:hypothetical protein